MVNIPNIITGSRVLAAPVMWYLIFKDNEPAFVWVLTFAFFTDLVDGTLARMLRQVTKIGSTLDSIGDSLTVLTGVIGLYVFRNDLFMQHLLWILIALSLHVIQFILSMIRYGKPSSFHTYSAKVAAFGIGIFILATFHFDFYSWLFFIAIVLLIIDALEESILVLLLPEWKNDVKGIYWVKNKEAPAKSRG